MSDEHDKPGDVIQFEDGKPLRKGARRRKGKPKNDPVINLGLLDDIQRALLALPVGDDPRRQVHQGIARLVADLMSQEDVDSRQMQRHVLACRTIGEHADQAAVDPKGSQDEGDTYEQRALAFMAELQAQGLDAELGDGSEVEGEIAEDEREGDAVG